MQIITLSIIYRELRVHTVLYRASNTEDKSSEWGNRNSREFSWNDMVGWQKNKRKFICRQWKKERGENTTSAARKSEWKWVTRTRMGPAQNWDGGKRVYFPHFLTPLPTLLYCFTISYILDLAFILIVLLKLADNKRHRKLRDEKQTEMRYLDMSSSQGWISRVWKKPKIRKKTTNDALPIHWQIIETYNYHKKKHKWSTTHMKRCSTLPITGGNISWNKICFWRQCFKIRQRTGNSKGKSKMSNSWLECILVWLFWRKLAVLIKIIFQSVYPVPQPIHFLLTTQEIHSLCAQEICLAMPFERFVEWWNYSV